MQNNKYKKYRKILLINFQKNRKNSNYKLSNSMILTINKINVSYNFRIQSDKWMQKLINKIKKINNYYYKYQQIIQKIY